MISLRGFCNLLAGMVISAGAVAATAPPETLALSDLVNHPDRFPPSVTVKSDIDFGGGVSLKKGVPLKVMEFNGSSIVVNNGNDQMFEIEPGDCDFLDAANQFWSTLTSEQRAIDSNTLLSDSSLWPTKIMSYVGFVTAAGKDLPSNAEYEFLYYASDGVHLMDAGTQTKLTATLGQTDLIQRAREIAKTDPAKRPSRIANVLRDKLVDAKGQPVTADSIDQVKVFAIYFGASWCGPCRQFSPSFVQYINSVKDKNPGLMTVMMSNDEKDADAFGYMTEEKMPWTMVSLENLRKTPLLYAYGRGYIPQLIIVDRNGKIYHDSYVGNTYVGPKEAMVALQKLVNSGVTK
jgi:thiol-disulfide isomerase/thioredoxin